MKNCRVAWNKLRTRRNTTLIIEVTVFWRDTYTEKHYLSIVIKKKNTETKYHVLKYSKSHKAWKKAGMWRVRRLLLVVYKIQLQIENTPNTQRPNTHILKIFKVTKWGRHWGRHEGRWIGGACCLLSVWPTAPQHCSTIGEDDWPRMCTFSFDFKACYHENANGLVII